MTTSVHQSGQYDEVGLRLGKLKNISSYTTVLGGVHIKLRYEHGTMNMNRADAIQCQRQLLAALATNGYPDVSGAAADVGDEL